MTESAICEGFSPIVPEKAKIMVLGTMPSVASLNEAFYYAHPRNAFWPIMARYFDVTLSTESQKRQLMMEQGILLWDVLNQCRRDGSLDSAISDPVPNNFESMFSVHTDLSAVLFNGQAAYQLFRKKVLPICVLPSQLEMEVMPSTSPAHAGKNFEQKYAYWAQVLENYL